MDDKRPSPFDHAIGKLNPSKLAVPKVAAKLPPKRTSSARSIPVLRVPPIDVPLDALQDAPQTAPQNGSNPVATQEPSAPLATAFEEPPHSEPSPTPKKKRHWGRSALVLAAAVAVPAMAAPDEWRAFALPEITAQDDDQLDLMAFETPGESFPGSAFYYLADEPYLTEAELAAAEADSADTSLWNDFFSSEDDAPLAEEAVNVGQVGAAASPLVTALGTASGSRALRCLTQAIYYEARSEPDAGQRAVAQVVLNRVKHKSYPNTVCGVVFQGSTRRTGCQFSFTCDGSMRKTPAGTWWARSERVARSALAGAVYRPVGLATHYHTVQIYPYWAPSLVRVGTVGAHHFYRFGNAAGQPGAFRSAYRGNEPATAAARRAAPEPAGVEGVADPLDPLAIQKAYDEAFKRAQAQNAATGGTVGGVGAGTSNDASNSAAAAPNAPAGAPRGTAGSPRGTAGTPRGGAGSPRSSAASPNYSPQVEQNGNGAQFSGERLPQSGTVKDEYSNAGTWIDRPAEADTTK